MTALDKLRQMRKSGKKPSLSDAQKWFKSAINSSKKKGQIGGATKKIYPGQIILFKYDPKTKDTLPYWDTQPMIIIVDVTPTGFTGLNIHYLPVKQRLMLFEALLEKTLGKNEKTRIRISYDLLKGASRYKWFKPTFKKYLGNHVRSKLILIPEDDWEYAIMLPTQKFQGASRKQIYKDSLGKV